jgi:hypothetical protein
MDKSSWQGGGQDQRVGVLEWFESRGGFILGKEDVRQPRTPWAKDGMEPSGKVVPRSMVG